MKSLSTKLHHCELILSKRFDEGVLKQKVEMMRKIGELNRKKYSK